MTDWWYCSSTHSSFFSKPCPQPQPCTSSYFSFILYFIYFILILHHLSSSFIIYHLYFILYPSSSIIILYYLSFVLYPSSFIINLWIYPSSHILILYSSLSSFILNLIFFILISFNIYHLYFIFHYQLFVLYPSSFIIFYL